METVAVLPPDERAALFQETAATMGISAVVVEKDFWVCFTLSRVFGLAEMPGGRMVSTPKDYPHGAHGRHNDDRTLSG